ncbi:MAG: hypothetical protein JJT99_11160 [Rhodobacteraceae bacterium]|nr:hypothetical protein [Paracoccaceae bacterium]
MPEPASSPKPLAPQHRRAGLNAAQARVLVVMVWLLAGVGYFWIVDFAAMDRVMILLLAVALVLPALLISIALGLAVTAAQLCRDIIELQRSSDELRRLTSEDMPRSLPLSPVAQSRIDALAAAQLQTDSRLALFVSHRAKTRDSRAGQLPQDAQPLLALGGLGQADADSPSPAELIRALHFPEDENDQDGFDALRKALGDARIAPLISAAQEVLTRLAQEGIYMDDLRPDRARPELWRAFAQGTRGPLVAALGGIRDRSCLALTAGRMRNDPEFRRAAHLFLREFDRVFAAFEQQADDAQMAAMADTRSARAFMLLGRVSGVFAR